MKLSYIIVLKFSVLRLVFGVLNKWSSLKTQNHSGSLFFLARFFLFLQVVYRKHGDISPYIK